MCLKGMRLALRYLLKPVEETKLFSLLDEISYALGKERRYLIENVGGETVKIPVDTIYSVEAERALYPSAHERG